MSMDGTSRIARHIAALRRSLERTKELEAVSCTPTFWAGQAQALEIRIEQLAMSL